ncbi:hypothetical protein EVU94_04430 [Flavobacteriaceae bacterium 144Ye]|nr:hypothetical protein EVU94_04430 [Flavobacteriaceae bacterium 144Ye]
MSKNLPEHTSSEEVDLGQLFNMIGGLFTKLADFIKSIFRAIFSVFIYALKAIIDNFKIIAIVLVVAGGIGFALEKTRPDVYTSQMLVKPYFDSKFQLVTNINYYNALIGEKDYKQLTKIFDINEEDAKKLIQFEIHPGPENENDQIKQYDNFLKGLDSIRAQEVEFDNFLENRSIYSGDIFEINVQSFKKDIFRSLEDGLNLTFTNTYSRKKMERRDSILSIKRQRIISSLKKVDSLKRVHIRVMEEESKNLDAGTYSSRDGLSFIQEKTKTKEVELLEDEMSLRKELSELESQKVEEDVFFDTLSSFQDVGAKYTTIWERYSIIFPFLAFLVLSAIYLTVKVIKYVKSYEG